MQDRLRSTTDASQRASELRSLSYRLIDAARLTTNGARQRIAAVRHSIPLRRSPTPEGGDALAPVVLVIDDHKDTREMYMVALEACGYRGWQAKDGATFSLTKKKWFAWFDRHAPDVDISTEREQR